VRVTNRGRVRQGRAQGGWRERCSRTQLADLYKVPIVILLSAVTALLPGLLVL
jgi:hypothetical protein